MYKYGRNSVILPPSFLLLQPEREGSKEVASGRALCYTDGFVLWELTCSESPNRQKVETGGTQALFLKGTGTHGWQSRSPLDTLRCRESLPGPKEALQTMSDLVVLLGEPFSGPGPGISDISRVSKFCQPHLAPGCVDVLGKCQSFPGV